MTTFKVSGTLNVDGFDSTDEATPAIENIAALESTPTVGVPIEVLGYHEPGDGGGGTFIARKGDDIIDGGHVFAHTDPTYRWYRLHVKDGHRRVAHYGVKASGRIEDAENNSGALRRLLAACERISGPERFGLTIEFDAGEENVCINEPVKFKSHMPGFRATSNGGFCNIEQTADNTPIFELTTSFAHPNIRWIHRQFTIDFFQFSYTRDQGADHPRSVAIAFRNNEIGGSQHGHTQKCYIRDCIFRNCYTGIGQLPHGSGWRDEKKGFATATIQRIGGYGVYKSLVAFKGGASPNKFIREVYGQFHRCVGPIIDLDSCPNTTVERVEFNDCAESPIGIRVTNSNNISIRGVAFERGGFPLDRSGLITLLGTFTIGTVDDIAIHNFFTPNTGGSLIQLRNGDVTVGGYIKITRAGFESAAAKLAVLYADYGDNAELHWHGRTFAPAATAPSIDLMSPDRGTPSRVVVGKDASTSINTNHTISAAYENVHNLPK